MDPPRGGFTTGEPWLPVGAESDVSNVAEQRADPASMLAFSRDVIRLRRSTPALHRGSYTAADGLPPDVFGYLREADGERWFVALNFGRSPVTIRLPGPGRARISTEPGRAVDEHLDSAIELGPEEGIVIELDATA